MVTQIEYRASSHYYARTRVVGPLEFSVNEGEAVGLVGSNGSGKTTAMKMALGLLRLHAGEVSVAGARVIYGGLPTAVSALIEAPSFFDQLTGEENLVIASAGRTSRINRIGPLLTMVGLTAGDGKRVRAYSQGMRQRLGIARALLSDPRHVLLDEPTNGLDPDGIRWVRQVVGSLKQDGKAVLLSSHLLGELQQITDRVVIMCAGKVVQTASTANLRQRHWGLEDLYLSLARE